ncbi:Actin-depolymerizing factor 10 [Linum perenne]
MVGIASSGMAGCEECKETFLELKFKRIHRFIVFKIEEKKQKVTVEKLGDSCQSYEDFTASLPENECRYGVFDLDFTTPDKLKKSKIFFFSWSPDGSKVRNKMLYASSKDGFRRKLDGVQIEVQATEPCEMSLEVVQGRAH